MNREEKQAAIERWRVKTDSTPFIRISELPYCCLCFTELTPDNIYERNGELWDNCLSCKDKVWGTAE